MFLDPNQVQVTMLDYGLFIVIAAGVPLASYISHLAFKSRQRSGDEKLRLKSYAESAWILIVASALVVAVWLVEARAWAQIGVTSGTGWAFFGALAFAAAASILLGLQVYIVRRDACARKQVLKALGEEGASLREFVPKTRQEYKRFRLLSVLAGVTEEVIFRGYLIWVLSSWTGLLPAAAIALAIFVLAHLYQENAAALAKVAAAGAIMTALYLISGSLIPAIMLHIAFDVTSNATVWHATRGARQ